MTRVVVADIGNQRLKWAILEVTSCLTVTGILEALENQADSGELIDIDLRLHPEDQFEQIAGHVDDADHVLYSCVSNKAIGDAFGKVCRRMWGIVPHQIYSESERAGLTNRYENFRQLGADRWLAALAAFHIVSDPATGRDSGAIVIDAGTAVTVDLVKDGQYRGGAILPGLAMLFGALGSSTGEIRVDTSSLIRASANANKIEVIATNSDAAVSAGVMASVIGGVERCVAQMQKFCQEPARVLVTGGDAEMISKVASCRCTVVPNLVLAGLALIAVEELA